MRILTAFGCASLVALSLAATSRPSAAAVIYPWCADYSGRNGRTELRVHQLAAMLGNPEGQWRLLQSQRLVSALSAAGELRAAVPPLISHAADHQIVAMNHLGAAFQAEDLGDVAG